MSFALRSDNERRWPGLSCSRSSGRQYTLRHLFTGQTIGIANGDFESCEAIPNVSQCKDSFAAPRTKEPTLYHEDFTLLFAYPLLYLSLHRLPRWSSACLCTDLSAPRRSRKQGTTRLHKDDGRGSH